MTAADPFGEYEGPKRVNPFGDDPDDRPLEPGERVRAAARKLRHLKTQVGVDGLPAPAFRALLDEMSVALDAIAPLLGPGADTPGTDGPAADSPRAPAGS